MYQFYIRVKITAVDEVNPGEGGSDLQHTSAASESMMVHVLLTDEYIFPATATVLSTSSSRSSSPSLRRAAIAGRGSSWRSSSGASRPARSPMPTA